MSSAGDTGSAGGPCAEATDAVLTAVAAETGVPVTELSVIDRRRLSGGASRLTWMLRVGSPRADDLAEVVLQQERPGSAGANLAMTEQANLVAAAGEAGVPVPRVLASGRAEDGAGFAVLSRLPGESLPGRIHSDPAFDAVRGQLAGQVGEACARIHSIDPGALPRGSTPEPLESMVRLLDALGEPHPALELGLCWLADNRPDDRRTAVVHGDLRMGNLLIDPGGLRGVLDWELAHLGSPVEDLGWFCARAWRFGSPQRAGGVGSVAQLLEGYERGGGERPEPAELDWWEAYACLRWGLICVLQASVHLSGAHRSVELAAIGRRVAECEEDLLQIVSGASSSEPPTATSEHPVGSQGRPTASELLEAVSEHLDDHRGTLEGSDAFHMRVARNVVLLVQREVELGDELELRHRQRLESLGMADEAALASAIRDRRVDPSEPALVEAVRAGVRDRLAVSHPGYWLGDEPRSGSSGAS